MPTFTDDSSNVFSYAKPTAITPPLRTYLHTTFPVAQDHLDLLKSLAAEDDEVGEDIWISDDQARFLQWFLPTIGAKRVLEVGCLLGYSSLIMAQALPQNGQVVTLEIEQRFVDLAKRLWSAANVQHKIKAIVGDARSSLATLPSQEERFDVAFIDADKENHHAYFLAAWELLKDDGIIMVDNALAFGQVAAKELDPTIELEVRAIQDFNHAVASDAAFRSCLIPVGDGLLMVRKAQFADTPFWGPRAT